MTSRIVAHADNALNAARKLGGPVALKAIAPGLLHESDGGAVEMLRSLKTFPLLDRYRARHVVILAAIQDVLLRVNAMVQAHPEIAESTACLALGVDY